MSTPNASLDAIARAGATQAIVAPPRMWSRPGLVGFFTTIDHKRIALRFLVTAFAFFTAGGVLSGLVRHQLAVPDNTFLGPDAYNQIFTMHGTTMMFLFAVPVMQGMALYLVPLMVGRRPSAALDAPLLVLRPPRGVSDLHARSRHDFADRRNVFPPPDFRLSGDGACVDCDRFLFVRAVGASHVRDGDTGARQKLFHGGEYGDRDPDGHPDLLLDRNFVDRPPRVQDAAAVHLRLLFHPHDRRSHRRDGRVRAARSAIARYAIRRRASALRSDRRRGISAARRDLLLVSEVHRQSDERTPRPMAFLADVRRREPHVLSD